jgi:hypothetical protein
MGPGEEEQGFYEQTGNVGSSDTGYLDQGYGADSNTADAQGECGGCMYAGPWSAWNMLTMSVTRIRMENSTGASSVVLTCANSIQVLSETQNGSC